MESALKYYLTFIIVFAVFRTTMFYIWLRYNDDL